MSDILIKKIPADLHSRLKEDAAKHGTPCVDTEQSIEQQRQALLAVRFPRDGA